MPCSRIGDATRNRRSRCSIYSSNRNSASGLFGGGHQFLNRLFALGGAAAELDRGESRWIGDVGSRRTAGPGRRDIAISAAISGAGWATEHLHAAIVPGAHDHVAKNHKAAVAQLHRQMSVGTHPDEGRGQGSAPLGLRGRVRPSSRSRIVRRGHRLPGGWPGRAKGGRAMALSICLARFTRGGLRKRAGVAHNGFLRRRIAGGERCDAWQQEAGQHALRELEHSLCYTNRAPESLGRGRLRWRDREGAEAAVATKARTTDQPDLQLAAGLHRIYFVKFQWPLSGVDERAA
jgi:hypothetical protein